MIDKNLDKKFFDSLDENLSRADIAFNAYEKGYHDAMEQLKQKPCEDCVSRDAVKNIITMSEARWQAIDNLNKLPSITPQQAGYCRIIVGKRGTVTNGDMIKAVFPNIKTNEFAFTIHTEVNVVSNGVKGIIGYDFWKEWWNAPYKTESEE